MADDASAPAAQRKPLGLSGLKSKLGAVAPPFLREVAPPKLDEIHALPIAIAAAGPKKVAAVRSVFEIKAPAAKVVAKVAAKTVLKPAATPVAPTTVSGPDLADMLVIQEEEAAAAAAAAEEPTAADIDEPLPFEGDLKEMGDLIRAEERADLYDTVVPDAYVPQTRRGFSNFIKTAYSNFRLPTGPIQVEEGEKYYPYQKFVRDYMRKESPYRGVLVYHGLGSGKTCTSIATAEALYSSDNRRIIVMTPASLRKNFQSEVSFCGFRHFQYNNYWVELDPADPTTALFASQVLNMSAADIKASRSIWVPDFRKPQSESNFAALPPESRDEIRKQIQRRLEYYPTTNPKGRMQFINYNGITNEKLLKLSCIRGADGAGPFDNSVIIIDEVHNLIRMMQASIEPYIRASLESQGIAKGAVKEKDTRYAGRRRVVPIEPITHESWKPTLCPTPDEFKVKAVVQPDGKVKMIKPVLTKMYTRAYMLFRLLLSAKNVKIVALSGTPIINFPEEIGILANILHGFTTVLIGTVDQTGEAAKQLMEATAKAHPFVDFVGVRQEEAERGAGRFTVTMSLLPEGIRKLSNDAGVERMPPEEEYPTVDSIRTSIINDFAKAGIPFSRSSLTVQSEELLPMFHDEFRDAFLKGDLGEQLRKDRMTVLITRLTGLISFYKGSNQELMPRVKVDEVVRVPFSLYAQKAYSIRRGQEIAEESKKEDKEISNVWKKIYGMGDSKSSSNYKTGSRQACNFAFPPTVARPTPSTKKQAEEEAKAGVIDDDKNLLTEYATIDEVGPADAAAAAAEDGVPQPLVPEGGEEDLDTDMDAAAAAAEDAQILAAIGEGVMEGGAGEGEGEGEEAAGGTTTAPAPVPAKKTFALLREEIRLKDVMAARALGQGPSEADCMDGKAKPGEDFVKVVCERAKECLRTTAKKYMLLTNKEDGLTVTSPKMAAILQRVLDTPGSSLVYSAFLTLEGIGIFTVAMDVNGFAPIRIVEKALPGGGFGIDFDDESKASIMKGPGKQNRYMLFTGGEKSEIRRMGLNLFNAKFDQLPAGLSQMLRTYGFTDNQRGQLCRVFCITSAGAEGLSLKNVRAVHIMEPYWNFVRMRQVKGRAVRIGSHLDLPEVDRDVSIYTYLSVFPDQAQRSQAGDFRIDADILQRDRLEDVNLIREFGFPLAPGQKSYVMTTDELIFTIMERKRKIFDIMESVLKASAVDCELNFKQNKDGSFMCLPLNGKVGDFAYHPILQRDIAEAAKFDIPKGVIPALNTMAAPAAAPAAPAAPATIRAPVPVAPIAKMDPPRKRLAPIQATEENAKKYAMDRLKAHVASFYEEVGASDEQLEKIDSIVEKYRGAIWNQIRAAAPRRGYSMEMIDRHEAEWKVGVEASGPIMIQRDAVAFAPDAAVLDEEVDAVPYKPVAVAAAPAPVPGEIQQRLKGKAYRMVPILSPDGTPTGFEMYHESAPTVLVGRAGYKAGKPVPPVIAVGGWTF